MDGVLGSRASSGIQRRVCFSERCRGSLVLSNTQGKSSPHSPDSFIVLLRGPTAYTGLGHRLFRSVGNQLEAWGQDLMILLCAQVSRVPCIHLQGREDRTKREKKKGGRQAEGTLHSSTRSSTCFWIPWLEFIPDLAPVNCPRPLWASPSSSGK